MLTGTNGANKFEYARPFKASISLGQHETVFWGSIFVGLQMKLTNKIAIEK